MTYDEFVAYIAEFLWRVGDQALLQHIDSLISMADAELNRDLKIQDRETAATLQVTSEDFPLPADYHSMRQVSSPSTQGAGEWRYITPAEMIGLRAATQSGSYQTAYSLNHQALMLSGPFTVEDPYDLMVYYQNRIPDFKTDDASWVADRFLDIYTYSVLKHTTAFIREHPLIAQWTAMYEDALDSALEDDAHERARGAANRVRLPRQASSSPNGGYYSRRFGR